MIKIAKESSAYASEVRQQHGLYNFPYVDSRGELSSNSLSSQPVLPADELWPNIEDLIVNDQGWFWSVRWQKMELEAESDLAEGDYKSCQNIDDMLKFLDSDDD